MVVCMHFSLQETILRNTRAAGNIEEVFENEKFDKITRKWRTHSVSLVSAPRTIVQVVIDPSSWEIDFSMSAIDSSGTAL
jgi:hypothetical protein